MPGRGSFLAASQEALLSQSREVILRELAQLIDRAKSCGLSWEVFLAEAAKFYNEGNDLSDSDSKYQQTL